ncbi:Pex2 / Pex12 amino terminal region [Nakaseomyces glabratus]
MSFFSNLPATATSNSGEGVSSLFPTIFEIVSSQEIDELLPASIRYILTNYWISRYPSWTTLQVNNYFEEWFGVGVQGLVEWYHIDKYNSTFVDKFYGLQRFNNSDPVLTQAQAIRQAREAGNPNLQWPKSLQLTNGQKRVVFLQKIILPYISHRLSEFYNKLKSRIAMLSTELDDETGGADKKTKLKRFVIKWFVRLYPLWNSLTSLLNMVVKLAFLTGRTGSMTFLEYLFKIEYTRMTLPLENGSISPSKTLKNNERPTRTNMSSIRGIFESAIGSLGGMAGLTGSQLFPAFIFMLRVYQWWNTEDLTTKLQKKLNDIDKDIPRPPNAHISEEASNDSFEDSEMSQISEKIGTKKSDICPICKDSIENPCVLETGYVTCYACALDYIPKHEGRCPVTGKRLLGCQFDSESGEWKVVTGIRRLLV